MPLVRCVDLLGLVLTPSHWCLSLVAYDMFQVGPKCGWRWSWRCSRDLPDFGSRMVRASFGYNMVYGVHFLIHSDGKVWLADERAMMGSQECL